MGNKKRPPASGRRGRIIKRGYRCLVHLPNQALWGVRIPARQASTWLSPLSCPLNLTQSIRSRLAITELQGSHTQSCSRTNHFQPGPECGRHHCLGGSSVTCRRLRFACVVARKPLCPGFTRVRPVSPRGRIPRTCRDRWAGPPRDF